jgi:hypothetical protein
MPVSAGNQDQISLDAALRVSIQRTLRIPDDGGTYPLPPALGRLPVRSAAQYPAQFPSERRDGTHFLVPMHRQEAAWLQFSAKQSGPRAVKIGVGAIDALTGLEWNETLRASPQNYIVCPYQPWVDGFKVGPALVRQFVAVPLQAGLTVEHQLTGEDTAGIRIACFAPKAATLAHRPLPRQMANRNRELGVGAGGWIKQRIYPDPLGFETWESTPSKVIRIYLIEAGEYRKITGETAPPSTIDAETYNRFGLPWFEVYDAHRGDIPATSSLSQIKSVEELTSGVDAASRRDPDTTVAPHHIRPIPPRSRHR